MQKHFREIDILITDVMMPEMTGPELVEILHRFHSGLKVIFMSGMLLEDLNNQGVEIANDFFISKPFHLSTVEKVIKKRLATAS